MLQLCSGFIWFCISHDMKHFPNFSEKESWNSMWGKNRESWLFSESFGGIQTKQKCDWSRCYFAYSLSLLLELFKLLELFLQISLPRNVHFTFPLILLNSVFHCVWIIWLEQIWWIWFNNPSFWITAFLGPWKKEICHVLCQRVACAWQSIRGTSCVDKLKSTFKCNGYTLGSRWGQRKAVTIWESELSVCRCWGSKPEFFGVGEKWGGFSLHFGGDCVIESHHPVPPSRSPALLESVPVLIQSSHFSGWCVEVTPGDREGSDPRATADTLSEHGQAGQFLIISKFLNSTGCYRNICIATTAPSPQKYLAEYKEEPHSCID